jgi:membrane protease YdiL (CAAX protease family)
MSEILSVVGMFVPWFLILWVANVAEERRQRAEPYQALAVMAFLATALLYGAMLVGGLLLQLVGWMMTTQPEMAAEMTAAVGEGLPVASWPLLAVGFWGPALVGLLLLVPGTRRLFSRFTGLDAANPVHGVALALSMLVAVNLVVTLGVGLGNMADMLAVEGGMADNPMPALWTQQILTALLAMVGVGWLSRRTLPETLARLGLRALTLRQWWIGVGTGLGMVPVVLGLEYLLSLAGIGASPDVERLTEQLLGGLFTSPWGILTLGLAAALGEETLFRGAMTPRFGLLFSSLLFALVHSNYGITFSTAVVLGLGLLLGWQRLRYNTTTAMVTHAVYNMTLGVLAYLGSTGLDV